MSKRLEHNALPNLEELKLFQQGKLSPERTREIKAIAQQNPLLKESLDGYAETGAYVILPSFENTKLPALGADGLSPIGDAAGSAPSNASWKIGLNSFFKFTTFTKICMAVILVSSVVVFHLMRKDVPIVQSGEQSTDNVSDHNTQSLDGQGDGQNQGLNPTTDNQNSNTAWVEAQGQSRNGGLGQNQNTEPPTNFGDPVTLITPIEVGDTKGLDDVRKPDLQPDKSTLIGVGMTEILHYRVADYSDYRKPQWSNEVFGEGHTPANLETKEKQPKEAVTRTLSYMAYLEECIRYYDHDQHQQAKEGLDALRKIYPEDVNAQFYGAMARFQMGEYAAAIPLFHLTETNAMRPFREESRFYRALALKNNNQEQEAIELLTDIANAGGFYAKKAKDELK